MEKLREQNERQKNPVGLPQEAVDKLIPVLDAHVCSLFVLFHQYQKHHWMVEGPQFRDLHLYLEEAYTEVHQQVDLLAERITVLGGNPTSGPSALERGAYIKHEAEGVFPIRTSLEHDLECELQITRKLRETVKLAMDLGDYGTKNLVEAILLKTEDRAHHIDHFLGHDTLDRQEIMAEVSNGKNGR